MPKLTNHQRVEQVGRWLAEKFPTPYPVEIRVCSKVAAARNASPAEKKVGDDGETYRVDRRIIVRVSSGARRYGSTMTGTLLHEWAHARTWRHEILEHKRAPHDDEWGLAYVQIYRAFYDEDGWKESRGF